MMILLLSIALSSSAISEAVEKLTGQRAHMSAPMHRIAGTRLEGPAITLHLVRDEKASATEAGLTAIKLIESAPAGSVVVAALEDGGDFAVFGSTFAALAKSRGLAGFVVDGAVRDRVELRHMGFPTFAHGTAPGSAGGHYRIDATNVPVRCGGIDIRPGDFVIGDADGVSVAPKERYAEVKAVAEKWQQDKLALLPLIEKHRSYLKALQEQTASKPR